MGNWLRLMVHDPQPAARAVHTVVMSLYLVLSENSVGDSTTGDAVAADTGIQ